MRRWAAALAALALLAAAVVALSRKPAEKPVLLLLTTLPILFGDGFALDAAPSPVLAALEETYRIVPIDVTDPPSLERGALLLMAQPRAQSPSNLVALDTWVRGGGGLLLFADPRLDWESEAPLGDLTRPPPMFADTGLVGHWGLRLDAPEAPGSPGRLVKTGGTCTIERDGLVARCQLGKGQAIVVADADLLDPATGSAGLDLTHSLLDSLQ
jgi:hypothetical protein